MKRTDERGFTALELVAVIVACVILLAVAMVFVRPKSFDQANDDANRRLGIAALAQGVKQYHDEIGAWPEGLPGTATEISNNEGGYDLCRRIVPGYVRDMAFDPQFGAAYTGDAENPIPSAGACDADGVLYSTGFQIRKNQDDSVTLIAPAAVTGALEITIR